MGNISEELYCPHKVVENGECLICGREAAEIELEKNCQREIVFRKEQREWWTSFTIFFLVLLALTIAVIGQWK